MHQPVLHEGKISHIDAQLQLQRQAWFYCSMYFDKRPVLHEGEISQP